MNQSRATIESITMEVAMRVIVAMLALIRSDDGRMPIVQPQPRSAGGRVKRMRVSWKTDRE